MNFLVMRNRMSKEIVKLPKGIVVAGFTIGLLLLPTYSQAKDYVKSAEEYLSENDVSAAVIELKNAIKEDPQQALPRFMLGEIHLSEGRFANAEKEFSRALEYGYDPNVVLPLLARSLLNENQPQACANLLMTMALHLPPMISTPSQR